MTNNNKVKICYEESIKYFRDISKCNNLNEIEKKECILNIKKKYLNFMKNCWKKNKF